MLKCVWPSRFTIDFTMAKLRSGLLVLVGIAGLVLYFSVPGLLNYSKNRTMEARSPSKVVIQNLDSPTNDDAGNGEPRWGILLVLEWL